VTRVKVHHTEESPSLAASVSVAWHRRDTGEHPIYSPNNPQVTSCLKIYYINHHIATTAPYKMPSSIE